MVKWNHSFTSSALFLSLFILAASFLPSLFPRLRLLTAHLPPSVLSRSRHITTMSSNYEQELNVALLAVQRATQLTKSVFHQNAKGTLNKSDASPVTIGDFGAQALIISALQANFPNDALLRTPLEYMSPEDLSPEVEAALERLERARSPASLLR